MKTISRYRLALAAGLLLAGVAPGALAFDAAQTKTAVEAEVGADYGHLDALYKDIHSHPEVAYQEVRTAARLAKEMKALGFEVTEHVGKTGIVAIYRNGAGPTVMVRTELDALPMEEKTGLPYASTAKTTWNGKETFVAHSCGHDIHMAAWVGTAKALVALKDQWHGTLMFIGQPSEEDVSGAKAMIDDGLFTRFPKPDLGFALHVAPAPAGTILYKAGVLSSTSDSLSVTFHGKGAHGSMPHQSIDPVLMAARFVVDVQGVISREKDPAAFGVVTVGAIQAGSAGNIIPDSALLRGTIRTFDDGVRDKILAGINRVAAAEAEMSGAPAPEVEIVSGGKSVINDDALTSRTAAVFQAAFGPRAVRLPAPGAASEDYSEFVRAGVPSLYFAIGGYDPQQLAGFKAAGKEPPVNHSPLFAPAPEPSIKTGVAAMTLAVMAALQPAR
ncbi:MULTISPECIES: amidohydrolase [Nitrospirillum]|uniref:Hippurate hydrolase n=1 Tax=Nitrospirillum amazonense TaxID=28077 RepID=A0A560G555_9PROT|nr:amidohydrolase [Nitrospirillum amazonense]MEC4592880.1 amidohydrolase [Nitrospirillum amazonense]TWB29027.1 hippurate hydrolase [Nitrospirillum amazonense]